MRVGLAGLGNIGSEVARWLVGGSAHGLTLEAAAGRDPNRVAAVLAQIGAHSVRVVALEELPAACEVLVDCLAPEASARLLDTSVDLGRIIVPVSVSVLLENPQLIERARHAGTRLRVPSGAVAGLDMLKAAALGQIRSVRIRTRKPPAGLGEQASGGEAMQLFAGTAREACRAYPRNVNIAATLALAGLGPELTQVEIWADPSLQRNVHEVHIESDATCLSLVIENLPSPTNPRSSVITAHSVCAVLQDLVDVVRIGT